MRDRSWLHPLALFAFALALRVVGIGFFLPHQSDPDDHAIDQLRRLRTGECLYVESWGKYGHLIARTLSLLPDPRTDAPLDPEHLDEHLRAAGADHLRARWISALLGALAAPLTYWLARTWLAPGWSFAAGAFSATSLLHLSFSQQARPHVPFTTLALLVMLAALRVRREPRPLNAVLYALALFLACGTLHSAAFLLPGGLLALLLRRPQSTRLAWGWIPLPVAAIAASLLVFWPFLYQRVQDFKVGTHTASGRFPHLVEASMFDGAGFRVWYDALRGYDPLLLAAAGCGAVALLVRLFATPRELAAEGWRALAVALSFALPCALVYGVFGRSFERFFLPLYPYLALLAALGCRDAAVLVAGVARASPALRGAVGFALAALVLALPTYAAARMSWLRAQPDAFEQAARFLDEQDTARTAEVLLHPRAFLPIAARVVNNDGDVNFPSMWMRYVVERENAGAVVVGRPLLRFPKALVRRITSKPLPGNVAALRAGIPALGCEYALAVLPDAGEEAGSLNAALAQCADVVWQVPGGDTTRCAENGYQERDMLDVVLHAQQWGPRLALWRLRKAAPK